MERPPTRGCRPSGSRGPWLTVRRQGGGRPLQRWFWSNRGWRRYGAGWGRGGLYSEHLERDHLPPVTITLASAFPLQALNAELASRSQQHAEQQQQLRNHLQQVASEQQVREAQWQAERGQLMEQIQRLTEEAAAAVAVAVGGASHEQGPAASCWASALGLESDGEDIDDEGGRGQQQQPQPPQEKPGRRLPSRS